MNPWLKLQISSKAEDPSPSPINACAKNNWSRAFNTCIKLCWDCCWIKQFVHGRFPVTQKFNLVLYYDDFLYSKINWLLKSPKTLKTIQCITLWCNHWMQQWMYFNRFSLLKQYTVHQVMKKKGFRQLLVAQLLALKYCSRFALATVNIRLHIQYLTYSTLDRLAFQLKHFVGFDS